MKKNTVPYQLLYLITLVNVLVATGYAIAGMVAPKSILPVGVVTGEASVIFAFYAASRTIPLMAITIYAVFTKRSSAIIILGVLAGIIQLCDGFVGLYQHDIMKTAGPVFIAILQFSVIFWVDKTAKNSLQASRF